MAFDLFFFNLTLLLTFDNECYRYELDLGIWPFINFILANKFRTVSAKALIFHMNNLPVSTTILTFWPWPLSLTFFLKTLILQISFEQRVLDMSISYEKIFPWIQTFFYPVALNLELDLLLKTWTLLITIEQWVLELTIIYFIWVFYETDTLRGSQIFLLCDLYLGDWPKFFILTLFKTI